MSRSIESTNLTPVGNRFSLYEVDIPAFLSIQACLCVNTSVRLQEYLSFKCFTIHPPLNEAQTIVVTRGDERATGVARSKLGNAGGSFRLVDFKQRKEV